jgi:hypothetical protein
VLSPPQLSPLPSRPSEVPSKAGWLESRNTHLHVYEGTGNMPDSGPHVYTHILHSQFMFIAGPCVGNVVYPSRLQ